MALESRGNEVWQRTKNARTACVSAGLKQIASTVASIARTQKTLGSLKSGAVASMLRVAKLL